MHERMFVLSTADGVPVMVHRWEPDGAVRGIVNLVHGMQEHAGRYEHVARAFNDVGVAVYAEDHRGHGRTAASEEDLGFFAERWGWAKVIDDLHRVSTRARQDHPGVPLVLFGHSMGSYLTQQYAFTFPGQVDALVLSGANGPLGALPDAMMPVVRAERLRLGPRGRSALIERIHSGMYTRPFGEVRTPFDWLSRDPDVVDRYIDDPRCGFTPTTQLYVDLLAGVRVVAQAERFRAVPPELPVYAFSGELDPVGGARGVAKLEAHLRAGGLERIDTRIYDDARHEICNELNRDEVIDDLVTWLEPHLAAAGR
jgi:alpha-beta hydrolase superfamily lysophospholipase